MEDLIKIKVSRSFQMNGKVVKKNRTLEVSRKFAYELMNNHKAVIIEGAKAEVIQEMGDKK